MWVFIALIALVLASLLFQLSRQGASAQISAATRQVALSCEAIRSGAQVGHGTAPAGAPLRPAVLQAAIDLALRDQSGVEGGFWRSSDGVVAYAFPTYDGSGVKRDAPSAELERIAATAQRALDAAGTVTDVRPGLRESVVFAACPASQASDATAAWTLKRVPLMSATVLNQLLLSTSLLLAFVVLSGIWLGWTLSRWRRHNAELAAQLAHAERLATLGRVAAGMAHEIRNPIGTMRLKAENALAAAPAVREARVAGALEAVLAQTERLDALVSSLLALAQPFSVRRQAVDLFQWLGEQLHVHSEAADELGITLRLAIDRERFSAECGALDTVQMARALDNLLRNALAHCARGGVIEVGARTPQPQRLLLWVADDGEGVPVELRDSLFDPFIGHRPGGTGLGLSLVREIVHAHGGSIVLAPTTRGARFEMELPWRAS
ncbi:ATP-binding protein [Herbaspirillum sp. LeCh32-8]|uniref:sensor histidine kinase n=1 Tax=Herbaspirillum sp. LeCh32-8 TaxID=2821356 RepID=UPI001FD8080F|nr:ATP-binding protein [Herbaspirillum sp. LeCh32-8]